MKFHGGKFWFAASELETLKLPGMPGSKRKINERADKEGWALQVDRDGMALARTRQARGGGLEYHVTLLPTAAQTALVRRGIVVECQPTEDAPLQQSALWSWYEAQSDKVKATAEERARVIGQYDALREHGVSKSNAVQAVSRGENVGASTLWEWLSLVDGVAPSDRLPHLAPRHKGGGREAELDPTLWQLLISDYLRPERPTFSSCYWRTSLVAEEKGLSLPSEKTLKRRVDNQIDRRFLIAKRHGADALRQTLPPQRRSVAHMHALEAVNIDGHTFDVWVRGPNARPESKPIRPVMIAIQDLYSRKIVAWRLGESESAVQTRLCFADLFRDWGIPKHCTLDNGRAFASKEITGGAKTRFRFTIKADEPTGLLTALGIQTHWAQPYRGQSKPIERAFRDLADIIARHPLTSGAYTGNRPDAKPENYMSAAVDWDVFVDLVNRWIAKHNARLGRRTETANGRSFDQVFLASYAAAPIGKATEEQMRLALLMGQRVSTDRKSGMISIEGNRYWAPELSQIAGKPVTIRFDPDNLHGDIHVYNHAGAFLVTAQLIEDSGFNSIAAARTRKKMEKDLKKAVRLVEEREDLLTAAQVAAMEPDALSGEPTPTPQVIRPVRVVHRNGAAAALKEEPAPNFMNRIGTAVSQLRLVE